MSCFNRIKSFGISLLVVVSPLATQPASAQPISARIINGSPVVGEAPTWMLSLHSADTDQRGHFCGASLVHPRYAVTAAHCVVGRTASQLAVTGGHKRLSAAGSGESVRVAEVFVHPGYNRTTMSPDVAVLELSRPLNRTPIQIFQADSLNSEVVGLGTVYGWGVTNVRTHQAADLLQQGRIPLVSNTACEREIGGAFDAATMLCAGSLSSSATVVDGVDTCQGDSGGPLVAVVAGRGQRLIGITSWGYGCATEKTRGVYTRVESVSSWISSVVPFVPQALSDPSILGTVADGQTLTCQNGRWDGEDLAFQYLWENEQGLVLGTGSSFFMQGLPEGSKVRCSVAARSDNSESAMAASQYVLISGATVTGDSGDNSGTIARDRLSPLVTAVSLACTKRSCALKIAAQDAGVAATGVRGAELQGLLVTRACSTQPVRRCVPKRESLRFTPQERRSGHFRFVFRKSSAGNVVFKLAVFDNAGNVRTKWARFVVK